MTFFFYRNVTFVPRFISQISEPGFQFPHSLLCNSVASGVVFLKASLREKAHVTLGFDGRAIAVDVYIGSRRVRAVNVYAPAQRHHSPEFFASLDVFLLDSYPTFLMGDFNCLRTRAGQAI